MFEVQLCHVLSVSAYLAGTTFTVILPEDGGFNICFDTGKASTHDIATSRKSELQSIHTVNSQQELSLQMKVILIMNKIQ
jgi:hypothetical protein